MTEIPMSHDPFWFAVVGEPQGDGWRGWFASLDGPLSPGRHILANPTVFGPVLWARLAADGWRPAGLITELSSRDPQPPLRETVECTGHGCDPMLARWVYVLSEASLTVFACVCYPGDEAERLRLVARFEETLMKEDLQAIERHRHQPRHVYAGTVPYRSPEPAWDRFAATILMEKAAPGACTDQRRMV